VQDISLHVLDLLENSVSAGARRIVVTVEQHTREDRLRISVEDDGSGFGESAERVTNPYYTTKKGKRVGLGLSLMRSAAEQAGGSMSVGRSALGGAAVRADMGLRHVDRNPMGNLAAAVSSIVRTTPGVDVTCRLIVDDRTVEIDSADVRCEIHAAPGEELATGRLLSLRIGEATRLLGMRA
jgi:signal transduction histidine kinase